MDKIYQKLESLITYIRPTPSDENTIDLQKTFSSLNIDLLPIVVKILELEAGFPTNQIKSHEGNKYHELEFFTANQDSSNSSNNKSLFERLDKTQTLLGSNLLKSVILKSYHSRDDIQTIVQNRQAVILELVENNKTCDNVIACLKKIQTLERDFLAMCIPDTPEMLEVYKIIFFEMGPLKYLNYNSTFLKIFYYFMIIFSPLYGMISPFVFIFAPFLFMKYIMKLPIPLDMFWNMMKKMIFGGTGFFSTLDKLFNSTIGTTMQNTFNQDGVTVKGVIFWLAKMLIGLLNSGFGSYAYIGFIAISYLYGIYNSIQVSITFNKVINMFHSRMNIISSWLRACYNMINQKICFNSHELQPIIKQIDNVIHTELVQNLLGSCVFTKEPGVISDKGMIIKTFKLFIDVKESLQNIIEPFAKYVAYVDMYTALGSWLREGIHQDRCITNFILEGTQPIIKGSNIWNICCSKPIYNDILLGYQESKLAEEEEQIVENIPVEVMEVAEIVVDIDKKLTDNQCDNDNDKLADDSNPTEKENEIEKDQELDQELDKKINQELEQIDTEKQIPESETNQKEKKQKKQQKHNNFTNVIITGPNGSGKSTYIKSITECLILSQTIGIVPAKEFTCTPFKHISTYLNIPDCQGKESLFQAEMNRCYNQLQMLEKAEIQGEYSFNIMDEIFVSTNYQEGMSGAYAVINQLCRFKNCLNIITTHFDTLANLEELPVAKKYFDIEILEDGSVSRDYKLRDGVSKKHMALKLLRNRGFSKEILDDAEKFYEKLTTRRFKTN
jgi:energy-coupling factor transporter ATP-binding protein EcfA2